VVVTFVRALLAVLSLIPAAFLAVIPLLIRRGGAIVEKARHEDDVYPCLPIPADVWLQPDAYLYSQPALMAMGMAVTWDNPDVRILDGAGHAVGSHDLLPSTLYRIQATIHNRSAAAPAPGMPVIFAPTGFGAGAPILTPIGTVIDLPVQGAPGEPALAEVTWMTPPTAGHFCIVISAVWPDDANPVDNIGQHNTVIRTAAPREQLTITVPVFGLLEGGATLHAAVDAYALPRAPILPVEAGPNTLADRPTEPSSDDERRLAAIVAANARGRFPAPEEWRAAVTPGEVALEAGASRDLEFSATVPGDASAGSEQRFNVIVTDAESDRLVGGVTVVIGVV
jgi:hypothetical protein